MATRRKVDLVGLLQAVDDVLVHYGVIRDDNSRIVASHDGSRVLYDRERPRTEIEITEV
jgi:Holliday junction resolvase RusA-like endonuclease